MQAAIEANLASLLHDRFRVVGELADLDAAVTAGRAAVRLAVARRTEYPAAALTGLCAILLARFQQTGQAADVDEAITAGQKALEGLPPDHPLRAYALHACSLAYAARYQRRSPELSDLAKAIDAGEAAVAALRGRAAGSRRRTGCPGAARRDPAAARRTAPAGAMGAVLPQRTIIGHPTARTGRPGEWPVLTG
jgi:hypothetical protein